MLKTFLLCLHCKTKAGIFPKISQEARFKIIKNANLIFYESLRIIKLFYRCNKDDLLYIICKFNNTALFEEILTDLDSKEIVVDLLDDIFENEDMSLLNAIIRPLFSSSFSLRKKETQCNLYDFLKRVVNSNKREFVEKIFESIKCRGLGNGIIEIFCKSKDTHLIPHIEKLKDFAFKEVAEFYVKNGKIAHFKKLVAFLNVNYRFNDRKLPISLFVYYDLIVLIFEKEELTKLLKVIISSIQITYRSFDYYYAYIAAFNLNYTDCVNMLVPVMIENDLTEIRVTNTFVDMIKSENIEMIGYIIEHFKNKIDKDRVKNCYRSVNDKIQFIIDNL